MTIHSNAPNRFRIAAIVTIAMVGVWPTSPSAQWIKIALPETPRTADGRPNLNALTPKAEDGRPDLSGIWRIGRGISAPRENPAGVPGRMDHFLPQGSQIPLRAEAAVLYEQRTEALGKGRPSERCLPHGVPDAMLYGGPMKIVQNRHLTLILFEEFNHYRQIFTDGRSFPEDPQPAWFGYSIGRWDGDAFVIESMGFNDQTWMDDSGLPHSDALRTTERFQRRDFGHLDLQVTFDDVKTFTMPWSVNLTFSLEPDTELIESICENERDGKHMVGK